MKREEQLSFAASGFDRFARPDGSDPPACAGHAHRLVVNFALANLYLHRRRLLESGA